jgi:hypothetical protein
LVEARWFFQLCGKGGFVGRSMLQRKAAVAGLADCCLLVAGREYRAPAKQGPLASLAAHEHATHPHAFFSNPGMHPASSTQHPAGAVQIGEGVEEFARIIEEGGRPPPMPPEEASVACAGAPRQCCLPALALLAFGLRPRVGGLDCEHHGMSQPAENGPHCGLGHAQRGSKA